MAKIAQKLSKLRLIWQFCNAILSLFWVTAGGDETIFQQINFNGKMDKKKNSEEMLNLFLKFSADFSSLGEIVVKILKSSKEAFSGAEL